MEERCKPLPQAIFTAAWISLAGCLRPGCQNQLIFCEKGGEPSFIRLSKYESNTGILINGFLANFQKSIAKWSMHRHMADTGLKSCGLDKDLYSQTKESCGYDLISSYRFRKVSRQKFKKCFFSSNRRDRKLFCRTTCTLE